MLRASLVFDGKTLRVPESMGLPCHHQLTGTMLENLGEIASRKCYESLGYDENGKPRGRSSEKIHEHILEVNNSSVYEHCNITLAIKVLNETHRKDILISCLNRKGIHVSDRIYSPDEISSAKDYVFVTSNLRAILEWEKYTTETNGSDACKLLGSSLRRLANEKAPLVVSKPENPVFYTYTCVKNQELDNNQAWISLYLFGSRGFTHEQVRHRYAMSQRSTRYVDESESEFVYHPLVKKHLSDDRRYLASLTAECDRIARKTYKQLFASIYERLILDGVPVDMARKQARGAARGFLPNNLASDMIFSTSVNGWRDIFRQRASKFADAEIRLVYNDVFAALQESQYADRFSDFVWGPSPDGIGMILI